MINTKNITNNTHRFLLLVLTALFAGTFSINAYALPQAMCIYYGQANDKFGWPYLKDADVIMRSGTNEVARHHINGSISPGVNFALYVCLDDGSQNESYSDIALQPGDPVEIYIQDHEGIQTIIHTNTIPSPEYAGQVITIDVTAGTDSDHDGMSDAWEQEIVNASTNPAISSIEDVKPNDDYDGDGESNWDEYKSGNFAFLDYDYLFIEKQTRLANRLQLQLLSVPGKAYTIQSVATLTTNNWQMCTFSTTVDGPLQTGLVEGDGSWLYFYVPYTNRYMRISVK